MFCKPGAQVTIYTNGDTAVGCTMNVTGAVDRPATDAS